MVVALAVAGCAGTAPGTGTLPPPASGSQGSPEFDKRAAQIADAWRAAGVGDAWTKGFVPVQDLTIVPPDGFPSSELKTAFLAGWYTTSLTLPTETSKGVIRYPDGSTTEVPLVSAAGAFQAVDLVDSCDGCEPLVVTDAKLTTAQVRTSRGVAEVPAWAFTAEKVSQPVMRVAVSPEAVKSLPTASPPQWDATTPFVSAQDLTAVHESTIEYRLGVGACDKEMKGLVWESADIVVIGGSVAPPAPDQACTAQLVLHPVQVSLSGPVDDRVILDAVTGQPVLLGQPGT